MENLKKILLIAVVMFQAAIAFGQSDATVQKAFSDSYANEYNRKYNDAISRRSNNSWTSKQSITNRWS